MENEFDYMAYVDADTVEQGDSLILGLDIELISISNEVTSEELYT